ncbi:TRAP transporter small permease [Chachezhania sediminis]|uniref:TRAP transporter small permease n=1 Tax=Chachezhania sediminis TaxID=2599291 RepID=UPI001E3031CA|nr:TRAP transporter small permease [Chachezhania sediminis]
MVDMSDTTGTTGVRPALKRLSAAIAWAEARFAGLVILVILCLLLTNVVSRAMGVPLIWTDELAIYLIAVAAFAGASLGLRNRQHIAVTLLQDALPDTQRYRMTVAVDVVLLAIFGFLAWMLWTWFDPVNAFTADSLKAYSRASFNFIYQEPTTTLGIRKVWFWLILPVFCITGLIHVLSTFAEEKEPI